MTRRREFLGFLSLTALIGLTSSPVAARQTEPDGYRAVPTWIGPADKQPAPDEVTITDGEALYISEETGTISHLVVESGNGWQQLETRLKPYTNSNLPTPDVDGRLVLDTDRGVPAWVDQDHYDFPTFVDDVLTSPVTKSNFSSKTEYWSFDINPGSMIKGRTYQLDLMGTFSTANTSDQFTVLIDLGGNELGTLQNSPDNVSTAPWSLEMTWTVREHGTTGKVQPHSRGLFDSQSKDDHHGEVTIDTTIAETLMVSINWDAADVDNTVTLGQGHLKQMS